MAQRGLLWKEYEMGELVPTWITAPGISIIRFLAVKYLLCSYIDVNATFFAEGPFNKLYCVFLPHLSQQYLMRVALPVELFFRTESEVTTLVYIRQ